MGQAGEGITGQLRGISFGKTFQLIKDGLQSVCNPPRVSPTALVLVERLRGGLWHALALGNDTV